MRNKQIKQETRVAKIGLKNVPVVRRQLNGLFMAEQSMSRMLPKSQTSTSVSLEGEYIRVIGSRLTVIKTFVPVVDIFGNPLMPTSASRARRWIKKGEATPFFKKGIFCIRLNRDPSLREKQCVVVGVDPGFKKEGYTIKSEAHTFLNIQTDAIIWVKDAIEVRRNMRRARRLRKTPCRKNKTNRSKGGISPSIRARWQWKLRICTWLKKMYPITVFIVEDIRAKTTGKKRWDKYFSPIEVGKSWFYSEIKKLGRLETKQGYETKELRDQYNLSKTKNKLSSIFSAHCVDSWVLANWYVGGHSNPDNMILLCITPLHFHRRQLHAFQPAQGGRRRNYGGTRSLGLKRGSLVKHDRYGIVYVGGTMRDKISVHSLDTGKRLCQNIEPTSCKFLSYNSWRTTTP